MSLAIPRTSSPFFSLTFPLTKRSLINIREALITASINRTIVKSNPQIPNAAVLIPLCNVNNKPGILLEVRGKLRSHSGEVRLGFPGGRVDVTDNTFLDAALRESNEELGILPTQVEILGDIGPAELSLRSLRVWPFVGYVHSNLCRHSKECSDIFSVTLPSLDLASLTPSSPEVEKIFHLPFSDMIAPARIRGDRFRGLQPYWAINVSDLVHNNEAYGVGDGQEKLEVWGLTGWYLGLLMKALGLFEAKEWNARVTTIYSYI